MSLLPASIKKLAVDIRMTHKKESRESGVVPLKPIKIETVGDRVKTKDTIPRGVGLPNVLMFSA
jgi:hypothetical protein